MKSGTGALRRNAHRPSSFLGPTCLDFDPFTRRELPTSLRADDHLVWLEAGAYHVPWETRFSHGLAAVLWHEDGKLAVARAAEGFAEWWGTWS